jgi:hypothetical protein
MTASLFQQVAYEQQRTLAPLTDDLNLSASGAVGHRRHVAHAPRLGF